MKLIKTEDEQGVMYSLSGDNLPENYVLSKENCDEIFGVVNVEKLAKELYPCPEDAIAPIKGINGAFRNGFRSGFNKAMELNKDKVFTIDDIDKAIEWATVNGRKGDITHYDIDNFIQYLQQPSEIDVTFNPDEKDSDGCLILTKI